MTIVIKIPPEVSNFTGVVSKKYDDSIILWVHDLFVNPFSVDVMELVEYCAVAFPWNCDFYKVFLPFIELVVI